MTTQFESLRQDSMSYPYSTVFKHFKKRARFDDVETLRANHFVWHFNNFKNTENMYIINIL